MMCGGAPHEVDVVCFAETSGFEGAATMNRNRPVDVTVLSLLFAFGALMCAVAAVMIHSSGSLHPIWIAVPAIATLGTEAVSWLVLVCIACVIAALGLWRISYWGYLTASILLILGLISHFWRAVVTNEWWRLLIVVTLGVLVWLYLRRRAGVFVHHGS